MESRPWATLSVQGDWVHGFTATLTVGADDDRRAVVTPGQLSPNPRLRASLQAWQASYRGLAHPTRIQLEQMSSQIAPNFTAPNFTAGLATEGMSGLAGGITAPCRELALQVQRDLCLWLAEPEFAAIAAALQRCAQRRPLSLPRSQSLRLMLHTGDRDLHHLPWHLWPVVEDHSQWEVMLCPPSMADQPLVLPHRPKRRVKILAILGDRQGIDTEGDRRLLEALPQADVTFLVEPQRQQITDQLWDQAWDILCFCGHSRTETSRTELSRTEASHTEASHTEASHTEASHTETGPLAGLSRPEVQGRLFINPNDSLSLEEIKYGLRRSIAQGLQMAIFNSCDGLGLAYELACLQLPQLIVMREPVPDRIAQEFLKYFLSGLAQDLPLDLALRRARERLQGLEGEFPCATWLPVGVLPGLRLLGNVRPPQPLTWRQLQGRKALVPYRLRLRTALALSIAVAAGITGVRHLGALQGLELAAYDQVMQLRPSEGPDPRIFVVTITEADIQAQPPTELRGVSLGDRTLERLLLQLDRAVPRAIGLDLFRRAADTPAIAQRYGQRNFFTVCKTPFRSDPGIPPPPGAKPDNIGFADLVDDGNASLRRHLVHMPPDPQAPQSLCQAEYAFSTLLALYYLERQQVKVAVEGSSLRLGQQVLPKLEPHNSGYQTTDTGGYQMLLNYRPFRRLDEIAPSATLAQVLGGQVNPALLRDRIVLIGLNAPSTGDAWLTPYSPLQPADQHLIPGVFLQAQLLSQLLSAALDQRPLIRGLELWQALLWIAGWSALGGVIIAQVPLVKGRSLLLLLSTVGLYGLCWGALPRGLWLPLVPAALALNTTALTSSLYQQARFRAAPELW